MTREEREARTWLCVLVIGWSFLLFPWQLALVIAVVTLIVATVLSVVVLLVTFDRRVDDVVQTIRAGAIPDDRQLTVSLIVRPRQLRVTSPAGGHRPTRGHPARPDAPVVGPHFPDGSATTSYDERRELSSGWEGLR